MAFSLFDKKISPACEYCEHGRLTHEGKMVECSKRGLVSPYFRCSRFLYNPVLRMPRKSPKLPKMKPDDFAL